MFSQVSVSLLHLVFKLLDFCLQVLHRKTRKIRLPEQQYKDEVTRHITSLLGSHVHLVAVLVISAVVHEGTFSTLSQEDLSADVAVRSGLSDH